MASECIMSIESCMSSHRMSDFKLIKKKSHDKILTGRKEMAFSKHRAASSNRLIFR